jgi:O-antigen/teichoic acid export membrane protein
MLLNILFYSGFFISLTIPTNAWLTLRGHREILFIRTLFGAGLNILLNLYAIPRYGIVGSAWATFIAYGISVSITFLSKGSGECLGFLMESFRPVRAFKRAKTILLSRRG